MREVPGSIPGAAPFVHDRRVHDRRAGVAPGQRLATRRRLAPFAPLGWLATLPILLHELCCEVQNTLGGSVYMDLIPLFFGSVVACLHLQLSA